MKKAIVISSVITVTSLVGGAAVYSVTADKEVASSGLASGLKQQWVPPQLTVLTPDVSYHETSPDFSAFS